MIWSPDGESLIYASNRAGPYDIYRKPTNGSGSEELVFKSNVLLKRPCDWSRDGRYVIFQQSESGTGWDIWILPLTGDRKPLPWLKTTANEVGGVLSPDGRWMAYMSDESGRYEIYVQPFPGPGPRHQVSTGGGFVPGWRSDGRELIFSSPDGKPMAAEAKTTPRLEVGEPHMLFKLPQVNGGWANTPDAQRFLVALPAGDLAPATPTVVLNWPAALKKR